MTHHENTQLHIIGVPFSSFTRSVQLLCEELQLTYSLGLQYKNLTYGFGTDALKQLNPFAKFPVLIIDGHPIFETQSILRYLDKRFNHGEFQSEDPMTPARIDQWCSAITSQVDRIIVREYLLEFLFPKGKDGQPNMENIERAIPKLVEIITILEHQIANNDWLLGQKLSLPDFLLAPMLHYLVGGPNNSDLIGPNSNLRAYVARWMSRISGQRILRAPQGA